jgi:tetratricopeptide (TPR) repeat protein
MLDRALETAEKLLAMDDSSGYAYFALSIIHLSKKQYEKAFADAEKLITLSPQNADNYMLMAAILLTTGRSEEAREMLDKAMRLNPAPPAWYFNILGNVYAVSGRPAEAVATHKRVFDHNPSHADAFSAHLELTLLYIRLGQEEEARTEAKEILKIVPNFSVEVWGQRNPSKDRAQTERSMADLRKAGLK